MTLARAALVLALACALPLRATAAPPAKAPVEEPAPRGRTRTIHLIAIAAGMVLYASSETFFKDAISPDHCRWCAANGVDRSVRDALVWNDTPRAVLLSNLSGYVAAPLATGALLAISSWYAGPDRLQIIDDFIPVFEATIASQIVTQLVKIAAARQRPYAHFATTPQPASAEDNLSFFSGHSSITMSIAVSMGTVAQRRGYKLAPAIWATGLGLAATTMYLRIAADRHYFTDVMTGATVGVAMGYFVPRLASSLPAGMHVAPTGNGLAVAGAF